MHAEIAQFPVMVAHADWSMHPSKRWLAKATLRPSRRYFALPPEPVKSLIDLFARLGSSGEGAILLGVDFPIGLPRTYADRAGIDDFVAFLPQFGVDPWHDFYKVANHSAEICIARPFYPHASGKKGAVSVSHLLKGLGMAAPDELRRRCDRATPARPAASALFWTLGAKQVGRAAIAGWRELLVPALRNGLDLAMWPFHGDLDRLLHSHRYVIAETYPAEVYRHLSLPLIGPGGGSKRRQESRRNCTDVLLAFAGHAGIDLDGRMDAAIRDGFGPKEDGEDPFDATVGLFGMLNVVLGLRRCVVPDDRAATRIEGWILGQSA
jgi:hypothetical protein